MNYRLLLFSLFFLTIKNHVLAQEEQRCHTFEIRQKEIEAYPSLIPLIQQDEAQMQQWINNNRSRSNRNIVTIPVVIHIVLPQGQLNTITARDVASQIDAMNEDYRRQNVDGNKTPAMFLPDAADAEIQFVLAKRTPDNQYTTGILYEPNPITEWDGSQFELLKQTAWPKEKYLNIWVCKIANSIIGYATFPVSTETDGIIIASRAFGRIGTYLSPIYNLGRTGTHETAHWLNCYHINGDDGTQCTGSDFCDDTPNQAGQNYGCPTFPHPSCGNVSDMFMNFLDYTRDSCMNIFTNCQKQRMWATLNTSRNTLLNSNTVTPPSIPIKDIAISGIIYPSGNVTKRSIAPQIRLLNNGSLDIDSCIIHYGFLNQDVAEYKWKGKITSMQSEIVVLPKIMDSIGYSIFMCYVTNLNEGVAEADTVNNFMSRRIYVPADAAKDTISEYVLIYPNPSSGVYTLKFDSLVLNNFSVEVFNIVGQTIRLDLQYNTLNEIQINLMEAPSGLYFIRVRNGRNIFKGKLLKLTR